ncbi:sigma-70 family RNA polymerase sigma factor [Arthrobacter sp. NA-172]|uniref:sigma-70 family RNA polymerase sigma factor n=1 Tax=Arthrobacter sp. NA-172 TaxID=3367524 RepID=UPI003754F883
MEQDSEHRSDGAPPALAPETHSDPQIMAMVREGDAAAFDVLYQRHAGAALYVARAQTDNASDADDVVSEAFASIFQALTEGKGPDEFFRSYLLTAVRRLAHDRNRKARRTLAVGDSVSLDSSIFDADSVLDAFESSTMARAFNSLPVRWQAVLWHVDIEGLKPSAAAPFIGLSPNGVSSLVIRAREGLRQAYLQNHISLAVEDSCAEYSSQLGKYARNGLKRSSHEKVKAHLEECPKCTALLVELHDIQSGMRAIVFPLVAGIFFTPAVPAGFLPDAADPTAAGLKPASLWKVAVAALVLAGLTIAGVLMWLGQTGPLVEADAGYAPSAPQVAPPSATLPPSPLPTSDPPPIAVPEPPLREILPAPEGKAIVVDSGTVFTTPMPQTSATSAPPAQTVSASFGIQPGQAALERQIDVGFSLQGDGTPTTGEAIFSLSTEAGFVAGKFAAPAGWTCSDPAADIHQIRCTTGSIAPSSLGFTMGVAISSQAENATLSYQFGGQRIVTKTFANLFH